jgi:hypothetical protein
MDIRPRQLAVAGAIAAAAFLGVGALTAASAQDSGDDSTTTTVEEQPDATDGSGTDNGTAEQPKADEDCPHDGQGPRGDRGDRGADDGGQSDSESDSAS